LNALFAAAWPKHTDHDFSSELAHSLVYLCAYQGDRLVGFVKLAWDGGIHAFLLDPTVHPQWQRRGIGRQLVEQVVEVARQRGMALRVVSR
ncbi:MAG TPA: GNAT family N-acetyltransferase, partial [Chloroflexota bacterium]